MKLSFKKTRTPQSYAARTDVGCVREHNEDSYLAKSPLFVVADGMGGHEAGEVASKLAVDTMLAHALRSTTPESLRLAVIEANHAVIRGAEDGTGKPGMGTTMTAATIVNDEVVIAQVGDSRAYLFRDGQIKRITRDHSLMADLIEQGRLTEAEARFHPQRSVITRALGSNANMEPDIYTLQAIDGDRLVLCSDGLSSMVDDEDIERILRENPDPALACDALVEEAIASGGLDNVTVIVIDPLGEPGNYAKTLEDQVPAIEEDAEEPAAEEPAEAAAVVGGAAAAAIAEPSAPKKAKDQTPMPALRKQPKHSKPPRQKGKRAPLVWAIAFVVILLAAAGGFYAYAQNSYYLIAENNVVCLYRGLPGSIGTLSFSWIEKQAPEIDISKLTPTAQSRLASGISVNSLEEADKLLNEYRSTSSSMPAQDSVATGITGR